MGGALAILVVLCFLGSLRRTLIIGLAIPVASVFTFFLMWMLGFTFNIFSLGGVALGVGMLVDNAIVMLENISRHQAEGGDPVEAGGERLLRGGKRHGGLHAHERGRRDAVSVDLGLRGAPVTAS